MTYLLVEMATRPSHKPGKPRVKGCMSVDANVFLELVLSGHSGLLIFYKIFPRNASGGVNRQPNIRVRPCRHRQQSLMRTARVRCAAQKQYHNKSYSFGTD